jgi:hypothetical protein
VDWEGIPPTAEWMKEIHAAIEAADTFVFVISLDSAASEVCKLEVEHAAKQHKRLVPVVYRDVPANRVPEVLTKLNWIFFRQQDDFNPSFQTLLKALDTNLDWVHGHTRLLVRAGEWDREKRDSSELLPGRIAEWKTGMGSVTAAGFDPSGRYAAVVHDGGGGHVGVWDLVEARRITSWESSTEVGASTQAVAVAAGGEHLVVSRYNSSPNVGTYTLTVRRLPEAARIASLQEKGQINGSLRLDPTGRYVFIVAGLNTWGANLRNGERLPAPTVDAVIYDMAFSANGAYLASVFRKKGKREFAVQIVDPLTGEEVNRWALPERGTSVHWSPDSTELAVGFKNTLSRYDATLGLALDTYARPENPSAESASGHLVATRVKDTYLLRVTNLSDGTDIVHVPLGGELKVAAFQPAAGTLATLTGGSEIMLAVWR